MKKAALFSLVLMWLVCISCNSRPHADTIVFNARILTLNDSVPEAEVLVIRNGKILAVGDARLRDQYTCADTALVDAGGQWVIPGMMDAHCHFLGYARNQLICELSGTQSWEDVLQRVQDFSRKESGTWITGRGWDQNDWEKKAFPDNAELNRLFPDRPVLLRRVDGHAAIANDYALKLAGIGQDTRVAGGEIERRQGKPTGILVDNAVDLVTGIIPPPAPTRLIQAIQQAEQHCFAAGLTSLADAGLDLQDCLFLDSLSRAGALRIFLYLMLNPTEDALTFARKGVYEHSGIRISSFKLYADGALGSQGARLKAPYCDRKDHAGLLIQSPEYYQRWCRDIAALPGYQANTHCIGDSAVSLLLRTYASVLEPGNDRRWRIEHAQVIDIADMPWFSRYGIVPSVQPTHAVSDGPWAPDRLCSNRMPGAYAYRDLLRICGFLPLGTDFPVESISPLRTWFTAVYKKEPGDSGVVFQPEQAITPEEALRGVTQWAARACHLEHRKGVLKPGMDADFVMVSEDLRTQPDDFPKVLETWVGGMRVYAAGK